MSIINITDRERELENALAKEQRLNGMGAEREYVLHGKVTQLTRALEQATEVLNLITRERNALKAELGDLPNSQAAMMCEIKVLRDALESAATSLETISTFAWEMTYDCPPIDTFMDTVNSVRSYSKSRADVARTALTRSKS